MIGLMGDIFVQKKRVGYFELPARRRLSRFFGIRRANNIKVDVDEIGRRVAESKPSAPHERMPNDHGESNVPFLNSIHNNILSTLNSDRNIKIIDIETYMVAPELSEEAIFTVRYGVRVYAVGTNALRNEIAHIPVYSHGDGGFVSEYASRSRRNKLQVTDAIAEYIAMIVDMDGLGVGIRRSRNVMEGWLTVD